MCFLCWFGVGCVSLVWLRIWIWLFSLLGLANVACFGLEEVACCWGSL